MFANILTVLISLLLPALSSTQILVDNGTITIPPAAECGFKIATILVPNQPNKPSFNNYTLNFPLPGGGGTPDILLSPPYLNGSINGGGIWCDDETHIVAAIGHVRFTSNFLVLQIPDDKSSAWNRVLGTGDAVPWVNGTQISGTQVADGGWRIRGENDHREITYQGIGGLPWERWAGWMVCYWWHLQPQLFWYNDKVTSLDQLPKDCAAVRLGYVFAF